MRKIRILLLFAATAALAAVLGGVFAAKASALAFQDEPCPPDNATGLLHVCKPDGEVGKPYAMPVTGRAGCTPESVVYSLPNGSLPPGLSMDTSNAHISGTPTTPPSRSRSATAAAVTSRRTRSPSPTSCRSRAPQLRQARSGFCSASSPTRQVVDRRSSGRLRGCPPA